MVVPWFQKWYNGFQKWYHGFENGIMVFKKWYHGFKNGIMVLKKVVSWFPEWWYNGFKNGVMVLKKWYHGFEKWCECDFTENTICINRINKKWSFPDQSFKSVFCSEKCFCVAVLNGWLDIWHPEIRKKIGRPTGRPKNHYTTKPLHHLKICPKPLHHGVMVLGNPYTRFYTAFHTIIILKFIVFYRK